MYKGMGFLLIPFFFIHSFVSADCADYRIRSKNSLTALSNFV